jgi:hypothetical protein
VEVLMAEVALLKQQRNGFLEEGIEASILLAL